MDLAVISSFFLRRMKVLVSLCIVTALGFWFWRYGGPGRLWFNYYGSCVIYELFWCLAVFFFVPRRQYASKITIAVFVATCLLEALQLWEPMFLEKIRATSPGAALIGTSFTWWQFPHYILGSLIGWLWLKML